MPTTINPDRFAAGDLTSGFFATLRMEKAKTIYIDYNILVWAAGFDSRKCGDAANVRRDLVDLHNAGYRITLSAWHIYELAQAFGDDQVTEISRFADELAPSWASNPDYIKRKELVKFLHPATAEEVTAHNLFRSQMWATFGMSVLVGEPLVQTVQSIRRYGLKTINDAADESPNAIQALRVARADGRLNASAPLIDRAHLSSLLKNSDMPLLDQLLSDKKLYLASCPCIAVEEYLSEIRVCNNFTPKRSHAADLQHAVVALAYCDHFVTDDNELREHSRQVLKKTGMTCKLHRHPGEILGAHGA